MTVSEALKKVSEAYAPGVVAFYSKMSPDPWQQAHDTFERLTIGNKNESEKAMAAENFSARCIQLIDGFKGARLPMPRSLSFADAFVIGDSARVKAIQSLKHRECYACGETKGLSIEPVSKGSVDVRLVCVECSRVRV